MSTNDTALVTLRQLTIRFSTAVHKDEIDEFHDHLNEQNADIQFTREVEETGQLPLLDCLVSRDENTLRTTVYRKPMYTDESSYNPTSHKATTIKTLTRRAQLVCNTPDSQYPTKTNTFDVFLTKTTTKTTLLDETLTDLLKLLKRTLTQLLPRQRLYRISRARPKPSDPTTLQHPRSPQTYHYATTFTD